MSTKLLSQPKYPDAIDINIGTLGYAPLGSSKQERRIKLGLYFKYGSSSYFFNYSSVPMPKYNL